MVARLALACSLLVAVASGAEALRAETSTSTVSSAASVHDFDFLLGDWQVHNRRLAQRLAGSHEWIAFDAVDSFHLLPGALDTEENYRTDHWPDFHAIGLHLYDPANRRWTLYWADSRNAPGTMQTLASGAFAGDIGTFYAPDTYDGKPITVRVIWKRLDRDHAYWEQAFSSDAGKTWETNWTMDFARRTTQRGGAG